jgi:D-lactate dehydrogenase
VRSHLSTGLLIFDDLRSATASLPDLVAAGLATIELMDATSLRVAQRDPEADDVLGPVLGAARQVWPRQGPATAGP